MKIYTRNGDSGQTRLIGGAQISKGEARIEAYGTLDELNSALGLCRCEAEGHVKSHGEFQTLQKQLSQIQNELFNAGSLLACEKAEDLGKLPSLPEAAIARLEKEIDQMTTALPPLREFILPGGSRLSCELHVARTLCRRAERETVRFLEAEGQVLPVYAGVIIYLNRLSDYLFTAARWSNKVLAIPDQTWRKDPS